VPGTIGDSALNPNGQAGITHGDQVAREELPQASEPTPEVTGPITLLTHSGDTTSLQSFKVTSAAIASFSPSSGLSGPR
jgi:hypothetical protein